MVRARNGLLQRHTLAVIRRGFIVLVRHAAGIVQIMILDQDAHIIAED